MYKLITRLLICISISILIIEQAFGTDYHVDRNNGSNITGNGTQSNPWETISYALSKLSGTGHTLYIANGIYDTKPSTAGWYEVFPLTMLDGISLIGESKDSTIINADSTNCVISCINIGDGTTLSELTITGGNSSSGGGIYCSKSSLTISNNLIIGNYSSKGSGIYCSNSSFVTILNNVINYNEDNEEVGWNGRGGGIYITGSSPSILENTIGYNSTDCAGGIYCTSSASPHIRNNIICYNYAEGLWHIGGGGIVTEYASPEIYGNIIIHNQSKYGPGGIDITGSASAYVAYNLIMGNVAEQSSSIYGGGGIRINSSSTIRNNTICGNKGGIKGGIYCYNNADPYIKNNILSDNSGYAIYEGDATSDPIVDYNLFNSNETGLYYDEGQSGYATLLVLEGLIDNCSNNLEGDPLYADTTNGDYGLMGGSPCIDAGDPASPLDPDDTRADIGAYSFDQGTDDLLGPITSNVIANPNPTCGSEIINLSATISDVGRKGHNILTSEYFINTVGENGSGMSMSAFDGNFNSATENVEAEIDIHSWTEGLTYKLFVHGKDEYNNWGDFDSTIVEVTTDSMPSVTTDGATNISATSATLNGTVNPNGLGTTVKFEYGMTTSYGSEKTATQSPVNGSISVNVSTQLSSLSSNTTYHYRVVATNSVGTTHGDDLTFNTLQSGSAPTVATNSATNVSATSSTLNGTVNPNGLSTTVRFEYGTSTDYGSEVTATQSPVSGTNSVSVSAPLSDLSPNTMYHYRVAATNSSGTTYGNDQSFSTIQSSDTQAPFISHSAPSSAPYNQSITITSTITDNTGVSSAKLYYRKGGDDTFTSTDMSDTGGDAYHGSIAANIATERGVEYYIEAKDNSDNTSYHPASNPTTAPHGISVAFSGLTCPNSTPTNSYRMISIPFNLNSKTPESVLEDDFGSYDNTKWRLIRWQSGGYQEYPANNIESFNPGNAFWLITKKPCSWDAGPGQSITTSDNYSITLQPGWNQIGNPFAFFVDWDDVLLSGNIEAPVGYEGQGNEPAGYRYNQTRLEPWKGYCVNNLESQSVIIEIPPLESSGLSKNIHLPELLADEAGEWLIQIKASCESAIDVDNYLGCLKNAEDCWDKYDFSEAPPIGKFISLYFPNTEWNRYPGHYTSDFRSSSEVEQAWLFKVVTNILNGKINLHFLKSGTLPEDREIILIDQSTKQKIDLQSQNELEYFSNAGGSERAFAILHGSRGFIDDQIHTIIEIPEIYQLCQNSPNPFNSTTRIQFSLPAHSHTTVEIYNTIGMRISTLMDDVFLEKGVHVLIWDGKNDQNHPVGSGIYYLFLTTDQFNKSIKMLLLR
jgi:hypothetical protein